MKKYFSLLLIVFFTTIAFAQTHYTDIVYLKNGSIIKGVIVEQIPNEKIKIETADGSLFVYQTDEITKITKEKKEETVQASSENKFEERNGYIGLTLGASIPVGKFASNRGGLAETGFNLGLVNFGYLLSDYIGISAMWFGAANSLDSNLEGDFDPWSYGGLMAGPLFSLPLYENIALDFRPMVGYAVTTFPDLFYGEETASSFAFNIGTVMRFDFSNHFAFLLTADYFTTSPEFDEYNVKQPIDTVTFGVGLAYRIK